MNIVDTTGVPKEVLDKAVTDGVSVREVVEEYRRKHPGTPASDEPGGQKSQEQIQQEAAAAAAAVINNQQKSPEEIQQEADAAAAAAAATEPVRFGLSDIIPGQAFGSIDELRNSFSRYKEVAENNDLIFERINTEIVPDNVKPIINFARVIGTSDSSVFNVYNTGIAANASDEDILAAAEIMETPQLSGYFNQRREEFRKQLNPEAGETGISAYEKEKMLLVAKNKLGAIQSKVNAGNENDPISQVQKIKTTILENRTKWVNALDGLADQIVAKTPKLPVYGEGANAVTIPVNKEMLNSLTPHVIRYCMEENLPMTQEGLTKAYVHMHKLLVGENIGVVLQNHYALRAAAEDLNGENAERIKRETPAPAANPNAYEETMRRIGLRD